MGNPGQYHCIFARYGDNWVGKDAGEGEDVGNHGREKEEKVVN